MMLDELFKADADYPLGTFDKPSKTCRTCKYRQGWQCGGSIIQY